MNAKEKLQMWQDRLAAADTAYAPHVSAMNDREAIYEGSKDVVGLVKGDHIKETPHVRNLAAEMIESQVNTAIPQPKVRARRKRDEHLAKLIEDMLKTCKECFTTRRIHLGLDETMDLGLGAYLKKNGYRIGHEIYLEHLNKVTEMAIAHGFAPMMWSDMFFRFAGEGIKGYYDYHPDVEITDEIAALVPKGVQQVFWDYYRPSEEFYAVNIEKHKKHFGENVTITVTLMMLLMLYVLLKIWK